MQQSLKYHKSMSKKVRGFLTFGLTDFICFFCLHQGSSIAAFLCISSRAKSNQFGRSDPKSPLSSMSIAPAALRGSKDLTSARFFSSKSGHFEKPNRFPPDNIASTVEDPINRFSIWHFANLTIEAPIRYTRLHKFNLQFEEKHLSHSLKLAVTKILRKIVQMRGTNGIVWKYPEDFLWRNDLSRYGELFPILGGCLRGGNCKYL